MYISHNVLYVLSSVRSR